MSATDKNSLELNVYHEGVLYPVSGPNWQEVASRCRRLFPSMYFVHDTTRYAYSFNKTVPSFIDLEKSIFYTCKMSDLVAGQQLDHYTQDVDTNMFTTALLNKKQPKEYEPFMEKPDLSSSQLLALQDKDKEEEEEKDKKRKSIQELLKRHLIQNETKKNVDVENDHSETHISLSIDCNRLFFGVLLFLFIYCSPIIIAWLSTWGDVDHGNA